MSIYKAALKHNKTKFLALSLKSQHKRAAHLLRKAFENMAFLPDYQVIEHWLNLPPIPLNSEAMSDRFHMHLKIACLQLKESNLLSDSRHFDKLSNEPYLPIDIYLDRLRSAHNVGSILRTTEAFRLGQVHFSEMTPFADHPKIQKSAMGCECLVHCHSKTPLSNLKRPFIALETSSKAIALHSFTFPKECTLFVGNEEFGLSKHILEEADTVVEIPLFGSKNSLNVAVAFAIAAAEIRRQLEK